MPDCKQIFIFSLPRSGSTLLQRLLASHPDIESTSECWFLLPLVYPLKSNGIYANFGYPTLRRAVKDITKHLPEKEKDYYAAIQLFSQAIYNKLNQSGRRYFLDKTPRYYLIINEIRNIFPDAKFIFLFRNPLSVYASLIDSFNAGRLGLTNRRIDVYKGPFCLSDGYAQAHELAHRVQFEELTQDPGSVLKGICGYLDISYDHKMMNNYKKVNLRGGLGDSFGINKYKQIEHSPAEKWKKTFATKYRKRHAEKYLAYLGAKIVKDFGFQYEDLITQIRNLAIIENLGRFDRFHYEASKLKSIFEFFILKRTLGPKRRPFHPHEIHY